MDKKLLIVDDDTFCLRLLEKYLANSGYTIHTATNGRQALQIVLEAAPDIVVTDWVMPEMDGIELAQAIRNHEGIGFTYVVMITAHANIDQLVEAFESGIDDFLAKPIKRAELIARLRAGERIIDLQRDVTRQQREVHRLNAEMAVANEKLGMANIKLVEMATTDVLTGLLNRREAMTRLGEQWAAQGRYGTPFSIVTLDIDHFKSVNDTHGHAAGDFVLQSVSKSMKSCVRNTDIVCRIGGEEFLIICQGVGGQGGMKCAEHLRGTVAALEVKFQGKKIPVTVSCGVAERVDGHASPDDLLNSADEALYESKRTGRNRVTLAGSKASSTNAAKPKEPQPA